MNKMCAYCGREIPEERKTCNRVKYCSVQCMRKANRYKTKRQKQYTKERAKERNRYYSDMLFRYDCKCAVCGWSIPTGKSFGLEIHHIVPVCEGGASDFDNLIVLCPNHHKAAHAGILDEKTLKAFQISDDDAAVKQEENDARVAAELWKYYHQNYAQSAQEPF